MTPTVPTKKEKTRLAIIQAAHRLFIEQGYAATSMRQIAQHTHVALGSLYNYFPSKESLFIGIIEERHPFLEILPILKKVEGDSVEQFCRNAAHTLVNELGHHPEFLNLMLTEIVEFKAKHIPLILKIFMPQAIPLLQHLSELRGELRPMPPLIIVRAFLGMFFSYYITGILLNNAMPVDMREGSVDHFVDIFLHGILIEETS